MSPITHFFAGWVLASVSPVPLTRREKALVVAAAVAPDIDGLGLVPELLTRHSAHPLLWYSQYHHTLHTLVFAVICALAAFFFDLPFRSFTFEPKIQSPCLDQSGLHRGESHKPADTHLWMTTILVFLSFHLHLICDLVGARGPDGDQWPIPYLKPFSNAIQLTWNGQWALNGWQNFAITGVLLVATFWTAWKYGSSPVELVSESANESLVSALRRRISSNAAP
ncbi:MAG: metal-dependent hydrolase [Candidatus Angelobacter sp.]